VGPYQQFSILNYPGAPKVEAKSALTLDARDMVIGGIDNWGGKNWICAEY